MRLKIILNQVQRQPGFVYASCKLRKHGSRHQLDVLVRPDKRRRPLCSGCGMRRPGYDTLEQRRFQFVPLWAIAVFFLYSPRRVDCKICGVIVELIPWATGKSSLTKTFAWFLASWAKRMSWKETASAFHTSWESVFRSVEMVVEWGLAHRDLSGITAIGVDEVLWKRGYKFLTVVYQINGSCRRLLWIGRDRKRETIDRFFTWFTPARSSLLQFVASDMWKPYLQAIAKEAGQAIHVLDRFHIVAKLNKAVDEVRAQESRAMKAKGMSPVLKHSRWAVLKNPWNLTVTQATKLADLAKGNLKTFRSYLLKEEFQYFWTYSSPLWAARFMDTWCTKTMRSRIEPMKKIAKTLRAHRPLILNWFHAKGAISSGTVEGLNNRLKVITRRAYGFREYRTVEIALYHTMGALPDPQDSATHSFC
jgi:transposase